MAINPDTQTSPGIGVLPAQFSVMGGCIIDVVGLNHQRLTAQKAASSMFKGWVGSAGQFQAAPDPTRTWLIVATNSFDPAQLATQVGGGITKANIRLTLYDGDSGSPNPVYVAMFGEGFGATIVPHYARWSTQPPDFDFDGGQNLYIGFEDVLGHPVNCGYMGERTTYRLGPGPDYATIDTFTGFPGCFGLTDPFYAGFAHPAQYMTPVQNGGTPGIWPVTAWFQVPSNQLDAMYAAMMTGTLKIGVHDVTAGDQFYDFTVGLPNDPTPIPLLAPCGVGNIAF